MMQSDVCLSVA